MEKKAEVHATRTRGMVIDASGVSHLERVRESHVCALYVDLPREIPQPRAHGSSHFLNDNAKAAVPPPYTSGNVTMKNSPSFSRWTRASSDPLCSSCVVVLSRGPARPPVPFTVSQRVSGGIGSKTTRSGTVTCHEHRGHRESPRRKAAATKRNVA